MNKLFVVLMAVLVGVFIFADLPNAFGEDGFTADGQPTYLARGGGGGGGGQGGSGGKGKKGGSGSRIITT